MDTTGNENWNPPNYIKMIKLNQIKMKLSFDPTF